MPDAGADTNRVMTLYGQAMTRVGSIFAIGMTAVVPFGLVSLAVTTRFLDPADFGRLAILYTIASVVTVLAGIGVFQGTLMSVYGIADDADGDGVADATVEVAGPPQKTSDERRRLLGTGLLALVAMATGLCAIVAVLGTALSLLLLGSEWIAAICWMALSAWAGAIWRVVHQIPRMERRPVRWATLQFMRPAFVLAGTIAALAAGMGISGVLLATAAGTLVAAAVAFLLSVRCFAFRPRWRDVSEIWAVGKAWVPLTLAAVVQTNANVLLLGVLATPASVGLFQVANRIAQIPSYFADGFITGWPAMERSPISIAAKDRRGAREYSASVFTLFSLTTLGLLFVVSLFSGALIRIAAPSYNSAATLIPIVAAAYGAQAVFRGVFRATSFPLRRYWYMLLHLLWIAPYAGIAAILIPLNPSYGVAIAQLLAGVAISVAFVAVDRRGPQPTPFQWKRLGLALLIAIGCTAFAHQLPAPPAVHVLLSVAALVAFPALLLLTGAVAREQIADVRAIVASVLPRRVSRRAIRSKVESLPGHERDAVSLLVCQRWEPRTAASVLGVSPGVSMARMTRGLRRIAGSGDATPVDHLLGEYVLHTGTTLERDTWAAHLRALGVDPLQLHVLDETNRAVSRLRGGPAAPAGRSTTARS